jgi:hypothetical protein
VYVDGPNGTRICTEHGVDFTPPAQCPQCGPPSKAAKPRRASVSSLAPEIDRAISDEVMEFEGVAEEAREMMGNEAIGDTARVAALRILLSAKKEASSLRMERARAAHLDRLKSKTPAIAAARDPRDDFGAASVDDAFIAGDN